MPLAAAGDAAGHALGAALTLIASNQHSYEKAYHEENEKLKQEMQAQFVGATQELKSEVEVVRGQNGVVLETITGFQDTLGRVTDSWEVASVQLAGISVVATEQQTQMQKSLELQSTQLQNTLDGQDSLRRGQESLRQTFETAIAAQAQSFQVAMEAQGSQFDACLGENTRKIDELQQSITYLGTAQAQISAEAQAASVRVEDALAKLAAREETILQHTTAIVAAQETIKLNAAGQVSSNLKLLGMLQLITGCRGDTPAMPEAVGSASAAAEVVPLVYDGFSFDPDCVAEELP